MRRERRFLLLIFLLSLKDLFLFLASHLCCSIFKGSFPRQGKNIRMPIKSNIFFWRPKNPKILFRILDLYTLFLITETFFRAGLNLAAVSTSLQDHWYGPTPLPIPLVIRNKGSHHGFFVFQHYSKNVGLVVSTTQQNQQLMSLKSKCFFPLIEGGVRKVRKPQNRTKNNKKPQYRIEIYRNTETAGCRRQDLQSFYPLKIRPAVYADINSNVKLLNY